MLLSPHAIPFCPSSKIRLTQQNVFDYIGHLVYDQADGETIYSTILDVSPLGHTIQVRRKKKIKTISIATRNIYVFHHTSEPDIEPGQ